MSLAATVVVLALIWAAATGDFNLPSLIFGAVVALLALTLLRGHFRSRGRLRRALRFAVLGLVFQRELMLSAVRVALLVMRPGLRTVLQPAIVAFPLTVTRESQITLLANLITLTPGTLSIDVSDDRKLLYIHALNCPDPEALIEEIATVFERRIIEAFA